MVKRELLLLKGEIPGLIDEWQDAPILWDAIRTTVDQRRLKGQFILTGSTVIKKKNEKDTPEEERRMQTGTGRISTMTMYPMSLYESTESSGEISFFELFDNKDLAIDDVQRNPELARLILRSYARNLCTLAKKSAMLEDVKAEMETTAQSTFDEYVDALKCIFESQTFSLY